MVIGWRERVGLPDLGLVNLPAKIDTGARTSALHASKEEFFERDGAQWVRFLAPKQGKSRRDYIELPVLETRMIKNTSGVPEKRIVIRTRLRIARRTWMIDLSLANRVDMTYPLIVGRSALSDHEIAVHTGRSYLTPS